MQRRRRTRTRAPGVGTWRRQRGGQRGRGAALRQRGRGVATALLGAAAGTAAKELMKPIAKAGLRQAARLSANYAMHRLLQGLSYKRKKRRPKPQR